MISSADYGLLTAAAFFAGLVDSMAGGGGLISLPALLAAGVPPHFALGTNKVQSCLGTSFSVVRYLKSGRMHMVVASVSAISALIGSYLGSKTALALSSDILETIMPFMVILVAVITFTRPDFGNRYSFRSVDLKTLLLSLITGLLIGFYDGFFGPGTGTFLTFIFVFVFGFDFISASANAKLSNFASNIAAVAAFSASGKVLWGAALCMAVANILGNWIGSGLAIAKGAKIIKPIFGLVLVLLFVKIIFTK